MKASTSADGTAGKSPALWKRSRKSSSARFDRPPDVALDPEMWTNYPFQRLTAPANVLIMPAIQSASISTKLIEALGGATVVGPLLLGLSKPEQICQLSDSVTKILTMATFAAYDIRSNLNRA